MDQPNDQRFRPGSWRGQRVLFRLTLFGVVLIGLCTVLYTVFFRRYDYDGAWARWQAQGVHEYEIVVEYLAFASYSGTWTLHITDDHIEIVKPPNQQSWLSPSGPNPDDLRFLTVDGQFAQAARLAHKGFDPDLMHTVSFDLTYGYPILLEEHPWPWLTIFDADWRITTKSLKIIKAQHPP